MWTRPVRTAGSADNDFQTDSSLAILSGDHPSLVLTSMITSGARASSVSAESWRLWRF
jgi:hypothetical protein